MTTEIENNCPECGLMAIAVGDGKRKPSRCEDGHRWHTCSVHGVLVMGAAHDTQDDFVCTCSEAAADGEHVGAEAQIDVLAKYIMREVEGYPNGASGGAGTCAIQVIKGLTERLGAAESLLDELLALRRSDQLELQRLRYIEMAFVDLAVLVKQRTVFSEDVEEAAFKCGVLREKTVEEMQTCRKNNERCDCDTEVGDECYGLSEEVVTSQKGFKFWEGKMPGAQVGMSPVNVLRMIDHIEAKLQRAAYVLLSQPEGIPDWDSLSVDIVEVVRSIIPVWAQDDDIFAHVTVLRTLFEIKDEAPSDAYMTYRQFKAGFVRPNVKLNDDGSARIGFVFVLTMPPDYRGPPSVQSALFRRTIEGVTSGR